MREYDLTGKLVVVTGGSRGIGHHAAGAFHEAGAQVVITGRDADTLDQAAGGIGQRCTPMVCDQRDPQAVKEFARQLTRSLGTPDVLIANAGGGWGGGKPVVDLPLEQWNATLQTNLTGTFVMCKHLLPGMIDKQRGDVLIVSSMSGKKGDPGAAAYAASKFGLQGFAQSLNQEVRRHNIRVMVLNPSAVNTEAQDRSDMEGPGLTLHAADLAALMVHLVRLPGRTLVRDMDIWGTNPFD
jgi:3-oxoacyl-[acyl-carrier protein] reductase